MSTAYDVPPVNRCRTTEQYDHLARTIIILQSCDDQTNDCVKCFDSFPSLLITHLFFVDESAQPHCPLRMKALQSTGLYLNPVRLLLALEDILPPNAILVADVGDFVGTAAYVTRARGPGGWLDPGGYLGLHAVMSNPNTHVYHYLRVPDDH